jgi:predicted metalloprotease
MPPPGYYYAPPHRRRRGGAGAGLAVALGFAAFLFVAGAIAINALAPSSSTTPSVGAPPAVPAVTSSPESLSQPSPGEPRGTTSGTGSRGIETATANRLYQVDRLNGYGCRGRPIAPGVSVSFAAFLHATTDCLDRSWATAFSEAGMPFQRPTRVFWARPGRSPCGDYPAPGAAAFYCPLNDGIYIGVTHAQESAGGLPVRYNVTYAREVAHEYGHHVQEQSGILDYSHEARMRAGSLGERNAITRRSELQAQCLAGTFMSAVRPSFPVTNQQWQIALRDSYGRGDDPSRPGARDHGSRRHYASWLNYAYLRGSPSACNTWTANPSDVS